MQPYAQGSVTLDGTDRRLLKALAATPRTGPVELAWRLEVARNTVQARLDKLISQGVVVGFGPDVDLATVGYVVSAFITLEIAQGRGSDVTDHLGGEAALGEAPTTLDALEAVAVATGDDGLEAESVGGLEDGEVGAGRGRSRLLVDVDLDVRRQVLRPRGPA